MTQGVRRCRLAGAFPVHRRVFRTQNRASNGVNFERRDPVVTLAPYSSSTNASPGAASTQRRAMA